MNNILSWSELEKIQEEDIDRINGITNSYSNLRLTKATIIRKKGNRVHSRGK